MAQNMPKGVAVAPLWRRVLATFVDSAVPVLLVGALFLLRPQLSPSTTMVVSIIVGLLCLGWGLLLWWGYATRGAGIGYQLAGLQLVGLKDGKPIGWGRYFLRQLVYGAICGTGVGFIALLIFLVIQERRQGWHDMAAGSVAISEPVAAPKTKSPRPAATSGLQPSTTVGLPPHLVAAAFDGSRRDQRDSSASDPAEQARQSANFGGGGVREQGDWRPPSRPGESAAPASSQPYRASTASGGVTSGTPAPPAPVQPASAAAPASPWGSAASAGSAPAAPGVGAASAPSGTPFPSAASAASAPSASHPPAQAAPSHPGSAASAASAAPAPGRQAPVGGAASPSAWQQQPQPAQSADRPHGGQPPAQFPTGQHPTGQHPTGQPSGQQQAGWGAAPGSPAQTRPAPPTSPGSGLPQPLEQWAQQPAAQRWQQAPAQPESSGPRIRPRVQQEPEDETGGTRMLPRKGAAASRPGTEGWYLQFDDGRRTEVGAGVLIGRNPNQRTDGPPATLVALGDRGTAVSKTHLLVAADQRGIFVVDRGSTNGTALVNTRGELEPCQPGIQTRCREGQVVSFGDRSLTILRTPATV